MAETCPGDPWRSAWLDTVQGGCLLRKPDVAAAHKMLERSLPIVRKRWPAETLYGRTATLLLQARSSRQR